jgi:hypothetical protein
VDLDALYDPNPAVFSARVDRMVRNVRSIGATDVFLQACSDADGDGHLKAAWFTNHQVFVRADIWSMVAERLSQQRLKVWARVPTMNLTWVWQQRPEWRISGSSQAASPSTHDAAVERARAAWPTRLAPDLPEVRRAAIDFVTDLAVYAPIEGVLFDDDAFMAPDERLALSRNANAAQRADAIEELLADCRQAVLDWRPLCAFARNVPAAVVEVTGTHAGFAQNFDTIVRQDGLAVVMAYPWSTGHGAQAARWVESLGRRAVRRAQAARPVATAAMPDAIGERASRRALPVLLKLQTVDWRPVARFPTARSWTWSARSAAPAWRTRASIRSAASSPTRRRGCSTSRPRLPWPEMRPRRGSRVAAG